jgi:Zn-dependent peptidase ImmA (M78 family)/DNA-binding XRE family transcriptional regulator
MFNPKRLTLARERRGLTKKRLAELVGISVRSITAYEAGESQPEDTSNLASALGFLPEFFMADEELFQPRPESVSFRSLATLTAPKRDAAIGSATIAVMLDEWIDQKFNRPFLDLPSMRGHEPEEAANALRMAWGLDDKPIKNMVHQLESKGVRVYSLAEMANEADALSFWREKVPFVLLNIQKSAERSRFDAAHELGHLVLHRYGIPDYQQCEREADNFASAFLMPRAGLLAMTPPVPTLEHIMQLKNHWLVSAMAMVYRLKQIGVLTEWQARILFRELAVRGYRRGEPDGVANRETSPSLTKIFDKLRQRHLTKADVAKELNLTEDELEQHVFGLVTQSVHRAPNALSQKPPLRQRPDLRLVK